MFPKGLRVPVCVCNSRGEEWMCHSNWGINDRLMSMKRGDKNTIKLKSFLDCLQKYLETGDLYRHPLLHWETWETGESRVLLIECNSLVLCWRSVYVQTCTVLDDFWTLLLRYVFCFSPRGLKGKGTSKKKFKRSFCGNHGHIVRQVINGRCQGLPNLQPALPAMQEWGGEHQSELTHTNQWWALWMSEKKKNC